MLEEYIRRYEAALATGDKKAMKRIERELLILGMDLVTLNVLIGERRKEVTYEQRRKDDAGAD